MRQAQEPMASDRQAPRGPACVQIRDVAASCAACQAPDAARSWVPGRQGSSERRNKSGKHLPGLPNDRS